MPTKPYGRLKPVYEDPSFIARQEGREKVCRCGKSKPLEAFKRSVEHRILEVCTSCPKEAQDSGPTLADLFQAVTKPSRQTLKRRELDALTVQQLMDLMNCYRDVRKPIPAYIFDAVRRRGAALRRVSQQSETT